MENEVFIWRRASPLGIGSSSRLRLSVKFFFKIYFHLYERRDSPPWRDLAIEHPRSLPFALSFKTSKFEPVSWELPIRLSHHWL